MLGDEITAKLEGGYGERIKKKDVNITKHAQLMHVKSRKRKSGDGEIILPPKVDFSRVFVGFALIWRE